MKTEMPSIDKAYRNALPQRFAPSKQISLSRPKTIKRPKAIKPPLPYGSKIGRLRVGPYISDDRCLLTCVCGFRDYLSPKRIRELLNKGMGCESVGCVVDSLERLLWTDVANSLKIQLFLLVEFFPEEVPSRWGGKLDDFEDLDLDQGYANFVADELRGETPTYVSWIERETPQLPFIPGNVVLAGMPTKFLAKTKNMAVDAGAGEMYLSEIMKFTNKTESEVLLKAFELRTFDGVIDALI